MIRVHGTSVTLGSDGILLQGPPGSGKSDLALRLIDAGALLVADDQTELALVGDGVVMSASAAIAGRIEVRGLGILRVPSAPSAVLRLAVMLVAPPQIERLPEPQFCTMLGRSVPLLALAPFEASAVAKLKLAVRAYRTGALDRMFMTS
jgi:HPr kinase/phosphorylase